MKAVRVVVHGWVQGVGFRMHVVRLASGLGLSGWVKNLADGGVEAEAAGAEPALRRFVEGMRAGSTGSVVREAQEQWFETAEAPDGFHVRR